MQYEIKLSHLKIVRMKEIVIGHEPFAFSEEIAKKYGTFSLLPEYQPQTFPIGFSFSLDDVEFVGVRSSCHFLNGLEFRNQVINDGYVPLDAHCAQALCNVFSDDYQTFSAFQTKFFLWEIDLSNSKNIHLRTLNFFGSVCSDNQGMPHIISFGYKNYYALRTDHVMMPFEAKDVWRATKDFAVVFTKDFVRKHSLIY